MSKQVKHNSEDIKKIVSFSCDLVASLQAYIITAIKDFDRCFDEMLNKQALSITIDTVMFDFSFTQDDKPIVGIRRDNNCIIVGLPYTALFAIQANPNKKNGFLAALDILKDVIALEIAALLLNKDDNNKIKKLNKSNKSAFYNSEKQCVCYATGIVNMLVNSTRLNRLLFCIYSKDKQQLLDFLATKYKNAYIYKGVYNFLTNLKDNNYKETIDLMLNFI